MDTIECDHVESVLAEIEQRWRQHNTSAGAPSKDLYAHLAGVLLIDSVIIDRQDGLEILEHCRTKNLPILQVLDSIQRGVRRAGYRGGPLSLLDCQSAEGSIYVFFDSGRFDTFTDVRSYVARRMKQTNGD